MPCYLVCGRTGQGKGLCSVGMMAEIYLQAGRRVATNMDIFPEQFRDPYNSITRITRIPDIPTADDLYALGFGQDTPEDEDSNGVLILDEASIFLNPGLVGLGILDAFSAGLPFVTTAEAKHSPEIDYLENRINGLIVSGDEKNFADSVNNLLNNLVSTKILRDGAKRAANKYTIENMVANVKRGILDCLKI